MRTIRLTTSACGALALSALTSVVALTAGSHAALAGPPVTVRAAPAGCPETRDADSIAAGQVAAERGWWQHWVAPERLWQFGDGRGVRVAVLDTGVNEHRQLAGGTVQPGIDLVKGLAGGKLDCIAKGTAVASIIAAQPDRGLAGLAPGAQILPVRVSEAGTALTMTERDMPAARLATGIRWAADYGAKVITVTVATGQDSAELRAAVAYALAKDAVLVAAVGPEAAYPAAYPGVIGVGAMGADGARAPAAAGRVDLYAPGLDMVVAARDSHHFRWQGGADAATAVVGACAALLRSAHPALTGAQVVDRLLRTATAAVIDPYRAVTELLPTPSGTAQRADVVFTATPIRTSTLPGRALAVAGTLIGATTLVGVLIRLVPARQRRSGERQET